MAQGNPSATHSPLTALPFHMREIVTKLLSNLNFKLTNTSTLVCRKKLVLILM